MIVGGGEDDGEAQQRNQWIAMEMNDVLVEIIGIFDAQQTRIDTREVSYGSSLVMAESHKSLKISNPPLMPTQKKKKTKKLITHFISGDLYKDLM